MAVSHCIHEFLKGDDQKAIPFFVPKYWTQHRIPFPRTSPVFSGPAEGSLSLRDSFLSSRACRGISLQLLPALGEVAEDRRGHPLRKPRTRKYPGGAQVAHYCAGFPVFQARLAQQSALDAPLWPIGVPTSRNSGQPFGNPPGLRRPVRQLADRS